LRFVEDDVVEPRLLEVDDVVSQSALGRQDEVVVRELLIAFPAQSAAVIQQAQPRVEMQTASRANRR
jgi:hypothetical protein